MVSIELQRLRDLGDDLLVVEYRERHQAGASPDVLAPYHRTLYERFGPLVHHVARRLCPKGSPIGDAEDVTNELFLKLFSGDLVTHFESGRNFKAYLLRSLRNLVCDLYRKKKYECALPEGESAEHASEATAEEMLLLASEAGGVEALKSHLAELKETDRRIITLRMLGYSHGEAARELQMSEDSARQRYSRSMRTLREKIRHAL